MPEHPNAALARRGFDAMNSGDNATMAEMLADDVAWYEIGRDAPLSKEDLAARYTGGQAPDFEISGELHDVVANDDHTIALVSAHATRNGKTLDYRTAEIYHVRDGKITARWAFSDDTAAINEFFA